MKTCMSCSAFARTTAPSERSSSTLHGSFLKRVWCLSTNSVRSIASLTSTSALSPAFGRLKSSSQSTMPLQRCTSLWIEAAIRRGCRRGARPSSRELEALGAGGDRRERIVDLVHDAGGERADRRELLGLREAVLRLAPLGDVLADGDDVRHRAVVEAHGDLRDAIGAQLAATRVDSIWKICRRPVANTSSNSRAQHLRRLAVQDLEDRAADRLLARHALHARLALAVPDRDAVLAVDHVQADRQRVDDALGDAALAVDLARALDDLALQALRVRGLPQHGGEDVGDGRRGSACCPGESRGGARTSAPSGWCAASSRTRSMLSSPRPARVSRARTSDRLGARRRPARRSAVRLRRRARARHLTRRPPSRRAPGRLRALRSAHRPWRATRRSARERSAACRARRLRSMPAAARNRRCGVFVDPGGASVPLVWRERRI